MELTREELNKLIRIYNEMKDLFCESEMMIYNTEPIMMRFSKWLSKNKANFVNGNVDKVIPQGPLCLCCGRPIRECGGCDGTC